MTSPGEKQAATSIPDQLLYFTESEVKSAVKDLYNNGHKESIFLFVTTENATQLNDFFQAEGRQEQAHLYSITDSFGQEGKQYPRSCCHVKGFRKVMEFDENGNEEPALLPVSSKTRMYLFDTQTEGAWWDHLVDMLSR